MTQILPVSYWIFGIFGGSGRTGLLAPTEAPTKSLFYCRERDRRRFTAAEYRFRLRALENARNAYKVARAHRSSAHAHGHVPMLKHACMALLCSRVPVPSTVLEYRQDTSLWCLEFVAKLKKEEAAVERTREPLILRSTTLYLFR